MPQQAVEFLPVLAHVAGLKHFPQARNLQETIWKQLGGIMHALCKRVGLDSQSERDPSLRPVGCCAVGCAPVVGLLLFCAALCCVVTNKL